ncbi:MAG TPA: type II toxin-antitoxin system Phd/YefM family antitoxin [Candidatus Dormibacteraeota bacterium]|nr:type II toxin-antitoxin system Phd/YefM family antitoxin [Candidatus Dormibacteraeota bacterium]
MSRESWTVAEAKAKFSEVLECARKDGPQRITRNGREAAVIVSSEEWERKVRRKGTLADFLAGSPLRESGLEIEARKKSPREVDL